MHLGDELVHARELLGGCLDDEIDAFTNHIELGVGDQHGDFDQNVFSEGKARHFAIDPD